MYFLRLYLGNHWRRSLLLLLVTLPSILLFGQASIGQEADYGPENLLKTLANPFNTRPGDLDSDQKEKDVLAPVAIDQQPRAAAIRGLRVRLNSPRLFLPERMTIGKTAEFLIKAPAGLYAAIAVADKNSGAKPIFGHGLRLGPDRKVVAVGKVPESGVLSLFVEAPIQGDLVDSCLYFEAALWSKPDFSDLQIASTVSPQLTGKDENGVVIASEGAQKKRGLFVFEQPKPVFTQELPGNLSSGKP